MWTELSSDQCNSCICDTIMLKLSLVTECHTIHMLWLSLKPYSNLYTFGMIPWYKLLHFLDVERYKHHHAKSCMLIILAYQPSHKYINFLFVLCWTTVYHLPCHTWAAHILWGMKSISQNSVYTANSFWLNNLVIWEVLVIFHYSSHIIPITKSVQEMNSHKHQPWKFWVVPPKKLRTAGVLHAEISVTSACC